MIFSKQNAQYFAMAIEETIDSLINNTEINYSNIEKISEVFTEENKEQFLIDATDIINNYFSTAKKSIYSGRSTKNAIADFVIDNQIVELKYVGGKGNGTYFNTSMSYCENLGFIPYNIYLRNNHILDELQSIVPHPIYQNMSPVSQSESHELRHSVNIEHQRILEEVKFKEKEAREKYVKDFYNFLIQNDLIKQFYYDMINKYSKEGKPDIIIVYNFNTKKHFAYSPSIVDSLKISCKGNSIIINQIRATFAWQNGTPLNNPTIRVFFK